MLKFEKKSARQAVEIESSSGVVRVLAQTGVALVTATASALALALPPDFTSLTAAVDFSTTITAILLVAAGLAGVAIIVKGGGIILAKLGIKF